MGWKARGLAIFLAPFAVFASEPVTWLTFPVAPNFIMEGALARQGAADQELLQIWQALPQFEHSRIDANFVRLFHDMARSDGICSLALFKSAEREKIAKYSARPLVHSGFRLITTKALQDKFAPYTTADGAIDLDRLLAAHVLRGSFIGERLLPQKVREAFDSNLVPAPVKTNSNEQALRLLEANRVDYVIATPLELNYQRAISFAGLAIATYPIQGVPKTVETYVVCSNMARGKRVIDAIDHWLDDPAHWETFTAPYRAWYDEADYRIMIGQTGR